MNEELDFEILVRLPKEAMYLDHQLDYKYMKRELKRQLKKMKVHKAVMEAIMVQCKLCCYASDKFLSSIDYVNKRKRRRLSPEVVETLDQLTQEYLDYVLYLVRDNGEWFVQEIERVCAEIDVHRLLSAASANLLTD